VWTEEGEEKNKLEKANQDWEAPEKNCLLTRVGEDLEKRWKKKKTAQREKPRKKEMRRGVGTPDCLFEPNREKGWNQIEGQVAGVGGGKKNANKEKEGTQGVV